MMNRESAVNLYGDNDELIMLTVPVPVSPYSVPLAYGLEDGIGSDYHRLLAILYITLI
jgi:hypothetical protein